MECLDARTSGAIDVLDSIIDKTGSNRAQTAGPL